MALITGAAGQDGILLGELLAGKGYEVWALVRENSLGLSRLRDRLPSVRIVHGDLRERAVVSNALEVAQPDEIYNLAAFSSVGQSWERAHEVMEVNALAVVGVLDEVRAFRDRSGLNPRFYQASSSEMFGVAPESPQTESTAFHPGSPYGVAKAAAHFLTVNYRESYDMFACSGILFNHESPLRQPHFVTRKVSMGVAAIAQGRASHIVLGSLDVSRDWGYAPDYVRAMWLMLQHDLPDDYVVASGRSHSLREFLTVAFACIGIEDWSGSITHAESLVRPVEVAGLVGDSSKARSVLGWTSEVDFGEMVVRMVEHDLAESPN